MITELVENIVVEVEVTEKIVLVVPIVDVVNREDSSGSTNRNRSNSRSTVLAITDLVAEGVVEGEVTETVVVVVVIVDVVVVEVQY